MRHLALALLAAALALAGCKGIQPQKLPVSAHSVTTVGGTADETLDLRILGAEARVVHMQATAGGKLDVDTARDPVVVYDGTWQVVQDTGATPRLRVERAPAPKALPPYIPAAAAGPCAPPPAAPAAPAPAACAPGASGACAVPQAAPCPATAARTKDCRPVYKPVCPGGDDGRQTQPVPASPRHTGEPCWPCPGVPMAAHKAGMSPGLLGCAIEGLAAFGACLAGG